MSESQEKPAMVAEVEASAEGAPEERQRWSGRWTFIIASIGAAVGLGNFWRFPGLTYKYGGFGNFCVPYLVALFFFGIPLLLMELGLGQKFQRGDVSVFRNIHRRLGGIGIVSVLSSYIIVFYYSVIIAWACVYIVVGFVNPLPWSPRNPDFPDLCKNQKGGSISRPEEYFYINVVHYRNEQTCAEYSDSDPSQFSVPAFFSSLVVWLCIFLAIFRGVHGSSCIVWFTVPIPLLFIIIMLINGATLEGAGDGVSKYLNGDEKVRATIDVGSMWADAIGQIFFSIGVCMGIMTSYGSYNKSEKPIILDNFIIAISNSAVSFVSGFAVWSIVGYLEAKGSLAQQQNSGFGLVFVAYPTAIEEMAGSNFWIILLGLTLFLLGVDSAFAMVEAVATVLYDMPSFNHINRTLIAGGLCVLGFLLTIPFCTNWGFILLDVVDHYLSVYLLYLVGILQCLGVGWVFDWERTTSMSEAHRKSNIALTAGYWIPLFIAGVIAIEQKNGWVGMVCYAGFVTTITCPVSYMYHGGAPGDWYENVFLCGVHRIAYSMSKLGRADANVRERWEPFFAFYFGFCVKFFIPFVLWFIMLYTIQKDVFELYGGYSLHWQWIGLIIPMLGLLVFFFNMFFCLVSEEDAQLDDKEFDDQIEMSKVSPDSDHKENAAIN